MFRLMFRFGLLLFVFIGVAATGVTLNENKIENEALQSIVTLWNSVTTSVHDYAVDNDEQIKEFVVAVVGFVVDVVTDVVAAAGAFVEERKDAILAATETAAEVVTNTVFQLIGALAEALQQQSVTEEQYAMR